MKSSKTGQGTRMSQINKGVMPKTNSPEKTRKMVASANKAGLAVAKGGGHNLR